MSMQAQPPVTLSACWLLLQVGWNDAQKYWLVRNSFGAGFADAGYFRVRAVEKQILRACHCH